MRILQFYLIPFLCFSLALGPYSYAQSQALSSEFPPVTAMQRFLIMDDYKKAKNAADFVRIFAGNRPREEQKYIEKKIAALGSLPRIERSENGVRLSQGEYYLRIDFSHASEKLFIVNGHRVQVDPNQPLPPQAEELNRRLEDARRGKYSLFSLFVPEAQSAEGKGKMASFLMGAFGFIGLALANKIIDRYGTDVLQFLEWEVCSRTISNDPAKPYENPNVCREYLKMKEEQLKKNPENLAVKNALNAGNAKFADFSVAKEVCPYEADNKYYQGTLKITRNNSEAPDKVKEEWVKIIADFNGEKLAGMKMLEDDDGKATTADSKTLATYKVDGDSILTEIEIPNPDLPQGTPPAQKKKAPKASSKQRPAKAVAEPSQEDIVAPTVKLSATADLKNDPKMQALQSFYRDTFVFIAGRLAACKAKKQDLDAAKALDAAKTKTGTKETVPASKSKGAK